MREKANVGALVLAGLRHEETKASKGDVQTGEVKAHVLDNCIRRATDLPPPRWCWTDARSDIRVAVLCKQVNLSTRFGAHPEFCGILAVVGRLFSMTSYARQNCAIGYSAVAIRICASVTCTPAAANLARTSASPFHRVRSASTSAASRSA